ncbi:type VI secretion system baseplate subunit TssF [Diaphorobacter aerolatus]|uniref:Type VI secretion system baseplate subunit TssF n=1 Tax=Diaphorobacter aerolatus TaxID=1288495 RepID=A0A7H0GLD3_9BURK|nr:type VI secretion system baseplate subunit TssF [Diaphorobacter aerolatus]
MLLLELICGRLVGGAIKWSAAGREHSAWLQAAQVSGMGFENDEALIPYGEQSFSGYRLVHEYFACPDRYRFFKISKLRQVLKDVKSKRVEIVLHFDRAATELEKVVSESHFHLFCTPVINLFPKKGDRIDVSLMHFEHHLLGDRTRPLDYEIYSVSEIQGYTENNTDVQTFLPIYETLGAQEGSQQSLAYFSLRREPRKLSEVARRNGPRTGYIGSEVYAQLVDRQDAPYPHTLSRIAPEMLCTNRDLSLLITSAGERNFQLSVSAPVQRVELVTTLTRPTSSIAERKTTWRLLSHLQLNYQTLTDASPAEGAKVMRELLNLYAQLSKPETAQQGDAIASVSVTPMYARMLQPGPIVYGRGVDIHLTVDQSKFGGASPWLFGAVLERFFARHVGINSATRLKMSTLQGGSFAQWATRLGMRPSA